MERGHFLIDMQKTGPKLAIFHGFFGQNVKKSGLLDWKLAEGLWGAGAGTYAIYVSLYREQHQHRFAIFGFFKCKAIIFDILAKKPVKNG